MAVSRMRNEKKICHLALIDGRFAKIPESYREHDGDVRFLTGSRNMAVSCMRNKKCAIWPVLVAKSPKFLHLMGNQGRRTGW